jgi:hypothetical protein
LISDDGDGRTYDGRRMMSEKIKCQNE